jgi:hypothetical protein
MKPIERMALVGLRSRVTRGSLGRGMVLGYREQAGGIRCIARESQGLSYTQRGTLLSPLWGGHVAEAIRRELEG